MMRLSHNPKSIKTFLITLSSSRQNRDVLWFCLLFAGYSVALYFLIYTLGIKNDFLSILPEKLAELTNSILNIIGFKTQTFNTIVFQPQGFAIEIIFKCTGILQFIFFLAGVLAYHSSWQKKLIGIVAGLLLIFGFNQLRLISLFFIGVFAIQWFDLIHGVVWEFLMILITFIAWLIYLKIVRRY